MPQSSKLKQFLSLNWYDQAIHFLLNFVMKTSELLLTAGIVVCTANFLTDGAVMRHNQFLSDAWAWAQAIAIDANLGVVFVQAVQAVRQRDLLRIAAYVPLTILLALVAGLITHFDSLTRDPAVDEVRQHLVEALNVVDEGT